MSNQEGRRGSLELPPIWVTDREDEVLRRIRLTPEPGYSYRDSGHDVETVRRQLEQHYDAIEQQHINEVLEEIELAKRSLGLPPGATDFDRVEHEKVAIENLLIRKRAELRDSEEKAKLFSGESPVGKGVDYARQVFRSRYTHLPPEQRAQAYDHWKSSYQAGLNARMQAKALERVIAEFEYRKAVFNQAVKVRAQEQARQSAAQQAAREQAQRKAAAEQAAREQAQRKAAAEQAAREQAQRKAAAEQAAREQAQRKEAQEQAARELAQREQAQREAAEEKARQLRRQDLIEAMAAVQASSAPMGPHPAALARPLVAALVNSPAARAAAVRAVNALLKAIQGFGRAADEFGNDLVRQATRTLESVRTTVQDFGEFFSASIPAAEVVPQSTPELAEIAAQGGSINLPGWDLVLGENPPGSIELPESLVTATAPVQVRSATFNEKSQHWSVAFPGNPGATLIWTPIAPASDSSTALPGVPVSETPYIGTPLSPVAPTTSALPATPPGMQGLITVFPADSGVPPLFTVFNSPYPGATFKGLYSGRYYNPEKAGGPILNLSWVDAVVTPQGIARVRLHTGRLHYSAANDVMIARLEKILKGELQMTDTDKRYYTHELRELERYRALGVEDGVVPEEIEGEVWNNAHAATLEDFQMKDDFNLLYTPEASEAGMIQDEKDRLAMMRGKK